MTAWKIAYTKQVQKDAKKIVAAGFKNKAVKLLEILEVNPFKTPSNMKSWQVI
jgi:Txe/YoeB family toxin of Txe-Axe toxin-antitoxin module